MYDSKSTSSAQHEFESALEADVWKVYVTFGCIREDVVNAGPHACPMAVDELHNYVSPVQPGGLIFPTRNTGVMVQALNMYLYGVRAMLSPLKTGRVPT